MIVVCKKSYKYYFHIGNRYELIICGSTYRIICGSATHLLNRKLFESHFITIQEERRLKIKHIFNVE